eukprot:CAMPEP_0171101086 /NCGR_PEP_ID=MMETSP0766_2-20121228/53954_1 /TAXON_ID=439317 /ORGANISM="Gambierdiscus australes, Strain CAWD 149" /LENGTH=536 /DNA_ID=CAMNT_0011561045 /DNA_START=62 /DNA_END=1672 /DNA_ORIENTATION=-
MTDPHKVEKVNQGPGLSGIVKVVVNTFLEQKHFRQLHRTLSEQWSGCHSLTAAVRLMEAHGVRISPEEEKRLQQLPEERMIDALVMKMPQQSREQFEHFFLQLSFIASTTTRLRTALEAGMPDAIEDALESSENVGVLPYIMKMAVAQAGQEVRSVESAHDAWLAEVDARMKPLLQSQANSMSTQKALAQARAEVEAYQSDAKEKSRVVLLGLANGNDKTLMGTTFVAWSDICKRMKRENEIRKEYEDQIMDAQKKLEQYKATQLGNVKAVFNRSAKDVEAGLLTSVIGALKAEASNVKKAKEAKVEITMLEKQLKTFADSSAANAKKVMSRMSAGSDEGLRVMVFQGWVSFLVSTKKDKEMTNAVKAAEGKVSEFMKKQNEGAKSVLQRMVAANETGLVGSSFQAWADAVVEAKNTNDMEATIQQKTSKLAAFTTRNKDSAKNASERVAFLQNQAILIYTFSYWKGECRCERMRRYGKEKNNKRKQELIGVKGLFKNFANELETSLKEGTPRVEGKDSSSKKRGGNGSKGDPSSP